MTSAEYRRLTRGVVLLMVTQVFLFLVLLGISYSARDELVNSQRAGCERGKADRAQQAKAWHAALVARTAAARDTQQSVHERQVAASAAAIYRATVAGLEKRSHIVCVKAFPATPLLPTP